MPTVLSVSQNYYVAGGSDQMFFLTNNLLSERGNTVIPFTAASHKNASTPWADYFPQAADFQRANVRDLGVYVYSPAAARALRRLIATQRPDIAHLHIYYGKLTTSILRPLKQAGIPIVQTLHEYKTICPVYTLVSNDTICEACEGKYFWRALPRKCNRRSLARTSLSVVESYVSEWNGAKTQINRFIAVSDFVRKKVIQYGVPAHKVTTIRNVIDASAIRPYNKLGEYFLYFGRLERVKGLLTLLNAVAPLAHTPTYIVGEGALKPELQRQIEERGLSHVKLLGFKTGAELQELIQHSLCTILPSEWYEPWGLTILEGFAHARPAIGSRIGGIPEVITDGADGFLFEAGNAEELRERLIWLADHPAQALEMGRTGRAKIERDFTPDIYYEQLMEVYRQALQSA
ncbi:MAG: glycosyl transferase [Anaerolineaceae bacterium]|nr:MAG: glycosyl transferase [Anaerolineaceae bacterium]